MASVKCQNLGRAASKMKLKNESQRRVGHPVLATQSCGVGRSKTTSQTSNIDSAAYASDHTPSTNASSSTSSSSSSVDLKMFVPPPTLGEIRAASHRSADRKKFSVEYCRWGFCCASRQKGEGFCVNCRRQWEQHGRTVPNLLHVPVVRCKKCGSRTADDLKLSGWSMPDGVECAVCNGCPKWYPEGLHVPGYGFRSKNELSLVLKTLELPQAEKDPERLAVALREWHQSSTYLRKQHQSDIAEACTFFQAVDLEINSPFKLKGLKRVWNPPTMNSPLLFGSQHEFSSKQQRELCTLTSRAVDEPDQSSPIHYLVTENEAQAKGACDWIVSHLHRTEEDPNSPKVFPITIQSKFVVDLLKKEPGRWKLHQAFFATAVYSASFGQRLDSEGNPSLPFEQFIHRYPRIGKLTGLAFSRYIRSNRGSNIVGICDNLTALLLAANNPGEHSRFSAELGNSRCMSSSWIFAGSPGAHCLRLGKIDGEYGCAISLLPQPENYRASFQCDNSTFHAIPLEERRRIEAAREVDRESVWWSTGPPSVASKQDVIENENSTSAHRHGFS